MRQLLFITCCLIIGPAAFCQDRTLDSLYQILAKHPQPDSARLKIIFNICYRENTLHPEKSKLLAEEALMIAKEIKAPDGLKSMGFANRYLALYFITTGDYTRAAVYAYEMLRIFEKVKDQHGLGLANELLGNVFLEQHGAEKNQAKDFYEKAIKIYQHENLKKDLGHAYNNLAAFYTRSAKYEPAEEYFLKSLAIRKEINDVDGLSQCYAGLAVICMNQKKYPEASTFFHLALPIYQKLNNQYRFTIAYMNMGKLFTITNRFDSAEYYLLKSEGRAQKIHHKALLYEIYYKLMVMEKKRNGFQNALRYAQLESIYHDSLFTKEKVREISDIKTRFETEKKDQQIKLLERDKELQLLWRNVIVVALLLIILLSIAVYFIQRYRDRKNREILNIQIDALVTQQNELSEKYKDVLTSGNEKSLISHDQQLLKRTITLLENKMSDPLFGVEEMCEELGMSRTNMHRKIKAITGFPPSELIRTVRLRKAAMLLRNQTDSISQIGFAVGFDNHSYFSKAFKKQFGVSPSEYTQSALQLAD